MYIVLFVGYMLMYTNTYGNDLYTLDAITRIFQADHGYLTQGRLWRELIDGLIGVSMIPTIIMLPITFVFSVITAKKITHIFSLKKESSFFCVSAIILSFPLINYYFLYGTDLIYYTFALMCASYGVNYIIAGKNLKAISWIIIGLFSYQMMISFAIALLYCYILKQTLKDEFSFRKTVKQMLVIVISAILYYILFKIIINVLDIQVSDYLGGSSIGFSSIFKELPNKFFRVYSGFFLFAMGAFKYLNVNILIKLTCILSTVIIVLAPVLNLEVQTKRQSKKIYYLLFVLLPIFTFSFVFIFGHIIPRAEFGMLAIFLYTISIVIESNTNTSYKKLGYFLSILLILYGVYFNVAMFMIAEEHRNYDTEVVTKIYTDLNEMVSYTSDSKVSFCGSYYLNNQNINENYPYIFDDIYFHQGVSAVFNVGVDLPEWKIRSFKDRYKGLFKRNGFDINVGDFECDNLNSVNSYYPDDGYIVEVDNNHFEVYLGPEDTKGKYTNYV